MPRQVRRATILQEDVGGSRRLPLACSHWSDGFINLGRDCNIVDTRLLQAALIHLGHELAMLQQIHQARADNIPRSLIASIVELVEPLQAIGDTKQRCAVQDAR